MARINLLPWRDELRKERTQQFAVLMVLVALAAAAVAGGIHFYMAGLVGHQKSRNAFIQSEIGALEKKIQEIADIERKKEALMSRMNIIQDLQSQRPVVVHFFDELVRTLPEGVVLSSVSRKGDAISLSGRAQSNERVSTYMRRIEASEWFGEPTLGGIQVAGKDGTSSTFSMTMKLTWKRKEEEER